MAVLLPQFFDLLDVIAVPEDLAELLAYRDQLQDEQKQVTAGGRPSVPPVAELMTSDRLSLDDAKQRHAELTAQALAFDDDSHTLRQALDVATRHVDRWLQQHTDDLIEDPVRAAVADLLSDAEDQHQQLADFAPTFDPSHLGTAGQRQAYTDTRDGFKTMQVIHEGWKHLWRRATQYPGSGAPKWLRPRRAGGVFAWEDPLAVEDLDARDGFRFDPIRIVATGHADQYRLASPREVVALAQQYRGTTTRPGLLKQPLREGRRPHEMVGVLEPSIRKPPAPATTAQGDRPEQPRVV